MSFWLLSPMAFALIAEGRRRSTDLTQAHAWETAALAAELPKAAAREDRLPAGMTIAGSTAEIRVEGVLTKKPDFFAMFFGGGNTTYVSLRNALAIASTDPNVKTIVLAVDSPGGSVDGLFETLDAIASLRASGTKTLRVRADNAQSAAYAIAAAAGPIEAVGRGSTFGSIGTAVSYFIDPDVVTLTNTESPDKRPDVTTEHGKEVVVKYLDQINDELVGAIARGRDVDVKTVTESYGRGASFTASSAKRIGMIDKIASTPPRAVTSKGTTMSEDQDNRAAIDAAMQRGVTQERDRVLAHLQFGETSGDMTLALEAIRSGASMTQEVTAKYLCAGMNRADRATRQTEATKAEAVVAGSGPAPTKTDLGDDVVSALKASEKGFVRA